MTYNAPVKRESDNQLGRAMWQWRTEQRLSMRGAAERLGVSHSTWGALERGIQREHRRKGWVYIGVGLVTDHYDDEPPPARKPAPTPAETPQETIERDLCDPCDPNSPIFTREQETWERSGKLDHIDHMDHTSEDLALAVNAPLPPPGANFPWASVRLLLEQVPYERRP